MLAAAGGGLRLLGWLAGLALGRVARRPRPPGRWPAGCWAAAVAVLPLPWRQRAAGPAADAAAAVPPVPRPEQGEFEVVAADIGQGTAVLVRTARHLLVYDAGPQYSTESDAGVRVLLPLAARAR
jgi:competence protein ComEC